MLYFTVVTKTHLPQAQVLMQRFADLDPASTRWVFLADPKDADQEETPAFETVPLESYIAHDEYRDLSFQYTAFELCNALRAFAHQHVFTQTAHGEWMYFDADIYPLDHCHGLMEAAPNAFLFLSPHLLTSTPPDRIVSADAPLLHRGVFNSGWMGMRRAPETEAFVRWFLERARLLFFVDYHNAFVDQLWLNFVPVLFPGLHIVRHPGANIAYWNRHERALEREENGQISCNGLPGLFFHFSGWSPQQPEIISRYAVSGEVAFGEDDPVWVQVAHEYAHALLAAGFALAEDTPGAGEHFADETPITLAQRRAFYEAKRGGEWPAGQDPFTTPEWFLPPPAEPEPVPEPLPEPLPEATPEPLPEPIEEPIPVPEPAPEQLTPPVPSWGARGARRVARRMLRFWSRHS